MPYTYEYPRPAVTADAAVFSFADAEPRVLLVRRGRPPFQGMWALPGGFMEMSETLAACAARELAEETGLAGVALAPFGTYDAPGRDPRHRTVTAVFVGVADHRACAPKAGDDAAEARWTPLSQADRLAFDHALIVADITASALFDAARRAAQRNGL